MPGSKKTLELMRRLVRQKRHDVPSEKAIEEKDDGGAEATDLVSEIEQFERRYRGGRISPRR